MQREKVNKYISENTHILYDIIEGEDLVDTYMTYNIYVLCDTIEMKSCETGIKA